MKALASVLLIVVGIALTFVEYYLAIPKADAEDYNLMGNVMWGAGIATFFYAIFLDGKGKDS